MNYKEHLFRGWDAIGDKGFIYGDLTHTKGISRNSIEDLYNRLMVGGYQVVPESIGMYTGMKDRRGNRIYEGDIVMVYGGINRCGTVVWHEQNAGFIIDFGRYDTVHIRESICEVIGNTYERDNKKR